MQARDFTGTVVGLLTVIRRNDRDSGGNITWLCRCACGGQKNRTSQYLATVGEKSNCGCLAAQRMADMRAKKQPPKHGKYKDPLYKVWGNMKGACYNPKSRSYPNYGAKGVGVCDLWRTDFVAFMDDMGQRPSRLHWLRLVEFHLGFRPGNVIWATKQAMPEEERAARQTEAARRYEQRNRTKRAERLRDKYHENVEAARRRNRERRAKNPQPLRESAKRYAKEHPDRRRIAQAKRRALKVQSPGQFSPADVEEILRLQQCRCAYCRKVLKGRNYHIDHIRPLSRGGANDRSNLQVTCPGCNLSKHDRDPIEFAQSLGRLL